MKGAGGRPRKFWGMKKCVFHCGDGLASVFLSNFTDWYTLNLQYVSYTSVKLLKCGRKFLTVVIFNSFPESHFSLWSPPLSLPCTATASALATSFLPPALLVHSLLLEFQACLSSEMVLSKVISGFHSVQWVLKISQCI